MNLIFYVVTVSLFDFKGNPMLCCFLFLVIAENIKNKQKLKEGTLPQIYLFFSLKVFFKFGKNLALF